MRPNFKTLFGSFVIAAFVVLGLASVKASEPEKVNYAKATYDISELKRNLGTAKLAVKSEKAENVSFKVELDKAGSIQELTYTHNISSEKPDKVQSYIQKAYMAIMSTTFFPAKKDGQAIADTVTINFELIN